MFMLHIGSYEKARNLARKAEDTSNIDTEDDNVQQRNRRPPTRYSDSGSDAGQFLIKVHVLFIPKACVV